MQLQGFRSIRCFSSRPNLKDYIYYQDGVTTGSQFINEKHTSIYNESINFQASFFAKQAQNVSWFKKFTKDIDTSHEYLHKWFPDGEINMCYNALDRHLIGGNGKNIAFYEDSVYTGKQKAWTYEELHERTGRLASVMRKQYNIQQGDRVLIYMPMVVEAAITMLACARIGAIHTVVFGGFAANELANRIDDCTPKLIVSSSMGIEPGKQIKYVPIVEQALKACVKVNGPSIKRLLHQRKELGGQLQDLQTSEIYKDFDQEINKENEISECVPVKSNHPLYIIYTSGTTGQPKGVVRDTGGTVVALNWSMDNVYDVRRGDVHFSTSDVGWVVGHSYIVYGPLLAGASSVFFEGKPNNPNPGVIWERCEKYKVKSLFMAPTGIRILKKDDFDGQWIKRFDTSSIQGIALAGERCDPESVRWINGHLPNTIINDQWWQTESGWPITGNILNKNNFGPIFPTLPGSVTRAVPGWNLQIFDSENKPCSAGVLGKVVIKMPLPPSFMTTLWGNDEAFKQKYFAETPGYYTTGDAGMIDERGYVSIMTRVDDVINTAGHRISTGRLEEVVIGHDKVVEAAVIGWNDPIKGECPLAFVVLKGNILEDGLNQKQLIQIQKEIQDLVRTEVGAFCKLSGVIVIERLPKTRSGKILRGTIRKIANEEKFNFPATIEDASSLDLIQQRIDEWKKNI